MDEMRSRMEKCSEEMDQDTINAVVAESKQKGKFAVLTAIDIRDAIPKLGNSVVTQIPAGDVMQAQKDDPIIGKVYKFLVAGSYPDHKTKKVMAPLLKTLIRQWQRLKLNEEGVLNRETKHFKQIVLPI